MLEDAAYLDALFTAIRAFTDEIGAAKRWLARAEQTSNQAWRLTFLHEARRALDRAPLCLTVVVVKLAELGPVEALPSPLNRVHENLMSMRADLITLGDSLKRAEAREAEKAVGRG